MPWWFRTIFWALLSCFLGGLALGLGLWWLRRRKDLAEVERRRLGAEAESDRLRLRLASLKDSEARVATLEGELAAARDQAAQLGYRLPDTTTTDDGSSEPTATDTATATDTDTAPATVVTADADVKEEADASSAPAFSADHRDDLKAIKGIGPVIERTLNKIGIQTYEQLATLTRADIDKVSAAIESFAGRIEREDWIGSAQRLLDAGHRPEPA